MSILKFNIYDDSWEGGMYDPNFILKVSLWVEHKLDIKNKDCVPSKDSSYVSFYYDVDPERMDTVITLLSKVSEIFQTKTDIIRL